METSVLSRFHESTLKVAYLTGSYHYQRFCNKYIMRELTSVVTKQEHMECIDFDDNMEFIFVLLTATFFMYRSIEIYVHVSQKIA